MPDGRCCSCSERQHMLTMRPLDAHGKWQGKTQKEYLCRKADEERGFTAQEFYRQKRTAGKSSSSTGIQRVCRRGLRHTGRPRAGVGALLEAAESGEIWASKPAVCALEQPGATAGLARSVGGCREPRTERKAAACPRHPSTAEIYRQIQTTATVDDILFSKVEQRAEQITADTRNDAVFTRKPTEPTR